MSAHQEPGGFLDDLKDVVRPYNLPEAQHLVPKLATDDDEDKNIGTLTGPTLPTSQQAQDVSGSPYGSSPEPNYQAERGDSESEGVPDETQQPTQHSGPPLTMQQLADQQSKAQTQANSEISSSREDDELDAPPRITAQQHVQKEKPTATRNSTRASTRAKDTAGGGIAEGAGHDDSEYVEDSLGSTRTTRASRRRRNAPLPSAGADVPAPTRTLRPRRRP